MSSQCPESPEEADYYANAEQAHIEEETMYLSAQAEREAQEENVEDNEHPDKEDLAGISKAELIMEYDK
jgi:hypothetical protein